MNPRSYKFFASPTFRQEQKVPSHPGFDLFRQVKAQILAKCVVLK